MHLTVIPWSPILWAQKTKQKKKKMMHYQRFQIKNEAGLKKHMYSHTEVILEGKVCLI